MRLMSADSRMNRSERPCTTRSIARPRRSDVVAQEGRVVTARGRTITEAEVRIQTQQPTSPHEPQLLRHRRVAALVLPNRADPDSPDRGVPSRHLALHRGEAEEIRHQQLAQLAVRHTAGSAADAEHLVYVRIGERLAQRAGADHACRAKQNQPHQPSRSAFAGSSLVARRAGTKLARPALAASTSATRTRVTGSTSATPNSWP